MYITSTAYNYLQGNPFSSYGDNVTILIQNTVLVLVLWNYMKKPPSFGVKFAVLASFVALMLVSIRLPSNLQPLLVLINLPLIISSRVPQIITNMQQKSTGQLSLPTYFLQFAGSSIRIFTTIQEVGYDLPLLSGFIIGASLNGILLLQIIIYRGSTPLHGKKKE